MYEPNFKGHWSALDKKIWEETNWQERDYEDLPIEDDTIMSIADFYGNNTQEKHLIWFVKCIRANEIYAPYYKPVMNKELEEILEKGNYIRSSMYDGHNFGEYPIHDRFESQEVYDRLSR